MTELNNETPISKDEMQRQVNAYMEYAIDYSSLYAKGLFNHGIIDHITVEKLHEMFRNIDYYQAELENIVQYFYITNADVHQLFEMVEILPSMDYTIEIFERNKNTESQINKLNKQLRKIKHKRLSRDIMKQLAATGTVVGIWLGDKNNLYPYVFEDLTKVFPVRRTFRGEWTCVIDIAWLDSMHQTERELYFEMFSDIDIKGAYNRYKSNNIKYQYYQLPYDRTFCLSTGKLKRNQTSGTSWGVSGLFDVMHKKKLKDLEQSLANKIINAVAILTIGTDKVDGKYTNALLPSGVKKKIHAGVKTALEQKQQGGVSVVTIPDYANLEFEKVDVDGLGGDKFETVNSDIKSAYGISGAMTNGEGTNYAIAKLNLDIFYKRLAVMLEDLSDEVYSRMFNLMLPSSQSDNYYMEYSKEAMITKTEKLAALKGLVDKGWSVKHYVEELGIRFEEYLTQTLWETEEQELQSKIIPYKTSYTLNKEDTLAEQSGGVGAPTIPEADLENENTIRAKESGN